MTTLFFFSYKKLIYKNVSLKIGQKYFENEITINLWDGPLFFVGGWKIFEKKIPATLKESCAAYKFQ